MGKYSYYDNASEYYHNNTRVYSSDQTYKSEKFHRDISDLQVHDAL